MFPTGSGNALSKNVAHLMVSDLNCAYGVPAGLFLFMKNFEKECTMNWSYLGTRSIFNFGHRECEILDIVGYCLNLSSQRH